MKNMQRLRILCIRNMSFRSLSENDGSIEYLSNNLRWFVWYKYRWKLLPQNFNPTRLVHLHLEGSALHYCIWNETKQLSSLRKLDLNDSESLKRTPDFTGMPNLEYLDLSRCRSLEEVHHSLRCSTKITELDLSLCESFKRTPDFSGMPNLEYLYLEGCTSLEEVHHSLRCSRKLIWLNLYECESLDRFPFVNVESLEHLDLRNCSSLEKFPEFIGRMKLELKIMMSPSGIRELPSSIFHPQAHLTEIDLGGMENLVYLPSIICQLKGLVKLNVSYCSELESLPEGIGGLENLEELHASYTLISRPPSSIGRLNKLKLLTFEKDLYFLCSLKCIPYFKFPRVNEGLCSLEYMGLNYCYLIDGGLPEDIGSLSSLKDLDLSGNNFEHLPRSIAQLGALQSLDLSYCKKLKELPCFTGMPNLDTLNLSYCNVIDGGLPEYIGSLSSLKELDLRGNNFEHLPRSIAQLGALQCLRLSDCKRLTQLPEFPQQLHRIKADWSNDSICNSLFQNISSLQHDISDSGSFALRVFTSFSWNIPSWFHHQGRDTSHVSVNLPENWYLSDNFLGFAVCYSGILIDEITAHLIPLCDDDGTL